jgi:hypothetical protein
MGGIGNAHKICVGKPEVKIPLRRPRQRWEDNIRMYVREIVQGGADLIHLDQDFDQYQ